MSQFSRNSMCFNLLGAIDKWLFSQAGGRQGKIPDPFLCHLDYPLQEYDWNISSDTEVCQPTFSFVSIPDVCLCANYISPPQQAMSLCPGYISASVMTLLSVPPLYLSQLCFFSIHLCPLLYLSVPAISLSLCSCSVPPLSHPNPCLTCAILYSNKEKNCSNILNNTFLGGY